MAAVRTVTALRDEGAGRDVSLLRPSPATDAASVPHLGQSRRDGRE